MRKVKIFFMMIAFATFMGGCTSDEVAEILGVITAKKDGVEWRTKTLGTTAVKALDKFTITGIGADNSGSLVIITNGIEEKTYELTNDSSSINPIPDKIGFEAVFRENQNESDTTKHFLSKEGTVTITSINTETNKMSGTFTIKFKRKVELLGSEELEMTNGEFKNVIYTSL